MPVSTADAPAAGAAGVGKSVSPKSSAAPPMRGDFGHAEAFLRLRRPSAASGRRELVNIRTMT